VSERSGGQPDPGDRVREGPTGPVPQGAPPPNGAQAPSDGASPTGHPSGPPAGDTTGRQADPSPAEQEAGGTPAPGDVAAVVEADLARLTSERDDYLEALRRLQADFENYRKRILRQQTEHLERAAEGLVTKLLPVLDSFDLALAHGAPGVEPVHRALIGALEGEGLERLDPVGKPFDPNEHEGVAHEEGGSAGAVPEVAEVMRPGYRWKGRLLRPAMVKVRG
jgi:molecular chaperone GrpE